MKVHGLTVSIATEVEEFSQFRQIVLSKKNMSRSTLGSLNPKIGRYSLVVAKLEEKVVGGVGMIRQGRKVYLDTFIVSKKWQRHGIGKAIVNFAKKILDKEDTLVALVAAYVGIQKRKFVGMGFKILYKDQALAMGIPYKDDAYAKLPKNKGCSVFYSRCF